MRGWYVIPRPFVIAVALLAAACASSQAVDWVTRFDGAGSSDDGGTKVVTDAAGNIYVAGAAGIGYETVKYDSTGQVLWANRYIGAGRPGTGVAGAVGIAVDQSGNVYVTGAISSVHGLGCDLVKYDANGNQLWAASYDSPDNDAAIGLVLDLPGNIYVCYRSSESYGGAVVIKYDPSGNQVWQQKSPDLYPVAMAADSAGSLVVTGVVGYDGADMTLRYDPDGLLLWSASYGTTGSDGGGKAVAVDELGNTFVSLVSGDILDTMVTVEVDIAGNMVWSQEDSNDVKPAAIAVDEQGRVYVTGQTRTWHNFYRDFLTVVYDASGNLQWETTYDNIGGMDVPTALGVDAAGNVFVTGSSQSATGTDYATVMYGSTGQQAWVKRYHGAGSGDAVPRSIAVVSTGGVVVTGGCDNGTTNKDVATVEYGLDGSELWVRTWDGPQNGDDYPVDMALDGSGGVYVAGYSRGQGTANDIILRYDGNGHELWRVRYADPARPGDFNIYAAVGDSSGVCFVGRIDDTNGTVETVKLDPSGALLWVAIGSNGLPYALCADPTGGYVLAQSGADSSSGQYVGFFHTTRIDDSGNAIWSRDDAKSSFAAWPRAVVADAQGRIAVTGNQTSGSLGATVLYDSAGDLLWQQVTSDYVMLKYVAIDASGNVVVNGDDAGGHLLTIKYSLAGNELWRADYQGVNGDEIPIGVVIDPDGSIYSSSWITTLKYDAYGNQLWMRNGNGTSTKRPNSGSAMTLAPQGGVFVTGAYILSPTYDYATVQYDASGNEVWSAGYAGLAGGTDNAMRVAADAVGNVFVTGKSYGGDATGFDIVTVKYTEGQGKLAGSITLGDYLGGRLAIPGVMSFREPGTTRELFTMGVTKDTTGKYSLASIPTGTYDVALKLPNWLRQAKASVTVTSSGTTLSFTLTNGDADGDNKVNIRDLSTVLCYFGTSGTKGMPGDVNWDASVGVSDISVVLSRFGKKGDP